MIPPKIVHFIRSCIHKTHYSIDETGGGLGLVGSGALLTFVTFPPAPSELFLGLRIAVSSVRFFCDSSTKPFSAAFTADLGPRAAEADENVSFVVPAALEVGKEGSDGTEDDVGAERAERLSDD